MTEPTVATQEARRKLYEIIRTDTSFERKAHDALELGNQYLGVENGHLTRIDRETDHWEAVVSTDPPDGRYPAGLELDLGTTYCRRTVESDSPIALHDAPNQGWADDPAFEVHELHCYHGATLILDEEPYGTVCFVSEEPRRERFSDAETMFAELVAKLLERELERTHHEAELTRQTNLATVLNRVLRHNLRNDMAAIRGFTQLIADDQDEEDYTEIILDCVDDLIALSQKARELDRIVTTDFEREPTAVTALVERVVETVTTEYPSASIAVESDEEVITAVLPSFERAVEELVENAAKHAGETPTVSVTIDLVPNAVEIQIADDGPGLADHEADVLEKGTETPLTHGSGLGLWLSHWIVTSHDGSLDAVVTDDGTTMTITIPRQPTTGVQEQLTRLTRARDQYQAAFEEANDPMTILNDDAQIVDANSAATDICAVDRRELLGQPMPKFLPEKCDFEAAWRTFRDAGADRGTVTVVSADNRYRTLEYSATADIIPGQHLIVSQESTD